jgi:anti-sigma B factor antagonist
MPSSPPIPSVEVRREPDQTFLILKGCDALDEHNCRSFVEQLSQLPEALTRDRLVLDLDGIRYVTSTALGALIAFNRRVREAGGVLALSNTSLFVREALTVTRLDQLMDILPTDEDDARNRQTA